MTIIPDSFPRSCAQDPHEFAGAAESRCYPTYTSPLPQPTTYDRPRPEFSTHARKDPDVLPSIDELLRGIRLTDPNPSSDSDYRHDPAIWTPTQPPTIADSQPHPGPAHRQHHKHKPSTDNIGEWEAKIMCLGRNDAGRFRYRCSYDDPVSGLCAFEASKQTVKRHYLSVHQTFRPYRCRFCDKGFTKANTMLLHESIIHTREMPFERSRGLRRCLPRSFSTRSISHKPENGSSRAKSAVNQAPTRLNLKGGPEVITQGEARELIHEVEFKECFQRETHNRSLGDFSKARSPVYPPRILVNKC